MNKIKEYYQKHKLSYFDQRIFDITNCQSVVKLIYQEPTIVIYGWLDMQKYNKSIGGWSSEISRRYLRLFS